MVCPKCGKEIPDGSLFCSYCFADISVVETYDQVVEQAVSDAMEDVTKHVERVTTREKARMERESELEQYKKRMGRVMSGVIAGVVVAALILLIYEVRASRTESHFVARAYEKAAEGDYTGAAADITHALDLHETSSGDTELLLTRSDYEMKAGDDEAALETLHEMLGLAMDSSETLSAWSRIVEIYSARGEYATIAGMLRADGDEEVQSTYRRYMTYDPYVDIPSGNYDEEFLLTISADGDGSIFYTLDGSRPTTASNLYNEPIQIRRGMTRVNAVYINRFGVSSRTISRLYWVAGGDVVSAQPAKGQ